MLSPPDGQLGSYAQHSSHTHPGQHRRYFADQPKDVAGLCRIIQGVLIHDSAGGHLYGSPSEAFLRSSRQTLPIADRVNALLAMDENPFEFREDPFARSVGTCRDFALMLCAMLREQGHAARVRCGFARYFHPPSYEDHWICEYWRAGDGRWARADAQLDDLHRAHLSVEFDSTDIPQDRFLTAWEAWYACRSKAADPEDFGHGDDKGAWFIRINLARDLLALGNHEVSDWDGWRRSRPSDRILDETALTVCDQMAAAGETASRSAAPIDLSTVLGDMPTPPPWLAG